MKAAVICAIILALACGGAGEPQVADDVDVQEDNTAGETIAPMVDACRAQMRTQATAESMYFARFDGYSDPVGLESSGVLPGARVLRCPESRRNYCFTLTFDPPTYVITCQDGHGYIRDGIASWD